MTAHDLGVGLIVAVFLVVLVGIVADMALTCWDDDAQEDR